MITTETLHNNKQLLINIVESYKGDKGSIEWKRAFIEHPEWEEQLGIKNGEDRQKMYVYVSKLKKDMGSKDIRSNDVVESKRLRKARYQKLYRERRKESVEESVITNNSSNNLSLQHVHFCPHCGCNLVSVEMALRLVRSKEYAKE